MVSSKISSVEKTPWYRRFTQRTSLYGFELIVSTIGLLTTTSVVIYGVYVLCNYFVGIDEASVRQFVGQASLWLMSTMIVWLPLTLFFYLRTRGEAAVVPAREASGLHKFIIGAYRFVLLMVIVGLLFSAVYSIIRLLVSVDDSAHEVILRVAVPGVIGAIVASGMSLAYTRLVSSRRGIFSASVAGLGLVVMIAVFSVSAGLIRDDALDTRTKSDLGRIQTHVRTYFNDNQNIPNNLDQLTGLPQETRDRLSTYRYTKINSTRYTLCATFSTDTLTSRDEIVQSQSEEYEYYASFYDHPRGEKCYKLTASYRDSSSTLYDKYRDTSSDSEL